MAIRWAGSADRHGISREDAMYAINHAVYSEAGFDESRVPGGVKPTLFIGPQRHFGAPLLEVMVEVTRHDVVIFHVMVARTKHLERMED
ncbi:hypothetical protein [Promicromonospora sp. NFX87]|uniref:hypothetical protein n=1 Tax=Promicromonospora sp. NFX87 TaxID=3402691 RepID=UPI003AFA6F35